MKKAEPPIFQNQLLAHLHIDILHFPKLTLIGDASRRYVATAFEAAYPDMPYSNFRIFLSAQR
jgi:hypothetical protein